MNTKTAYSRPEEKKVIDTETGEELTLTHTAVSYTHLRAHETSV